MTLQSISSYPNHKNPFKTLPCLQKIRTKYAKLKKFGPFGTGKALNTYMISRKYPRDNHTHIQIGVEPVSQ